MNGHNPDPEDPFEYVEDNLINASEAAKEAENSIDTGPTASSTADAHQDVMNAVRELENMIGQLEHAGQVLDDAEVLASGADDAYERILEARDFIDAADSGLGHIQEQQSIPAGEITVAGVDYEVHLTAIDDN